MQPDELRARFATARESGLRAREAAHAAGVSEGEAVAAHAGLHGGPLQAAPLTARWLELLQSLELCGPVLALTRNESTVHEKTGVYEKISGMGHIGLALGEQIDLRLFFERWHAGYAVTEAPANPSNAPSLSLQFFDVHGVAVHKIYARDATDRDALRAVIAEFTDAAPAQRFEAAAPGAAPKQDIDFDAAAVGEAWSRMTDTHQFFGLLGKFEVERQQSFRLVRGRFTQEASVGAVRELLQEASFDGTPIMVFVASPGCIQIHSGPVMRIEPMEINGRRWLNVLDPGFNLHLLEDAIAHVWVVEKPTADGVVTSVEAFDHDGELMAMFFGARKPGVPEREEWRSIVRKLTRLAVLEQA